MVDKKGINVTSKTMIQVDPDSFILKIILSEAINKLLILIIALHRRGPGENSCA
jgi:hypothetical protein